jgi:hypothetical protein
MNSQFSNLMPLDVFDLVFVITALAFNLLIAALFIASKKMRLKLMKALGIAWLSLAIPLGLVFTHYLLVGREVRVLLCFGGVFVYMIVELLLDYVLKIEFRNRPSLHIPYILLEYVALFGLIGISFSIDRTWGYSVSISFWVLMASLIYLYWGKKTRAA